MYGIDGTNPGLSIEESQEYSLREKVKAASGYKNDRKVLVTVILQPCYAALRASLLTFMWLLKKREQPQTSHCAKLFSTCTTLRNIGCRGVQASLKAISFTLRVNNSQSTVAENMLNPKHLEHGKDCSLFKSQEYHQELQ